MQSDLFATLEKTQISISWKICLVKLGCQILYAVERKFQYLEKYAL